MLSIALIPADVYVIYELCSYDKFILNIESFWCNLLSDEERSVLEYGEDILVSKVLLSLLLVKEL